MNDEAGTDARAGGLVLASRSPRRTRLLDQLGLVHEVCPADIDEDIRAGEDPVLHAERLAREKALHVARDRPGAWVIGSDTVVIVDGDVVGKPVSADDATRMLLRMQGREHVVASGVAVAHGTDRIASGVEEVRVRFRAFDEPFARAYVRTGEPMDKAGAYGIQGHGAALVERIEGDYFAVMGLPLVRLLKLFEELGRRYDFSARLG